MVIPALIGAATKVGEATAGQLKKPSTAPTMASAFKSVKERAKLRRKPGRKKAVRKKVARKKVARKKAVRKRVRGGAKVAGKATGRKRAPGKGYRSSRSRK